MSGRAHFYSPIIGLDGKVVPGTEVAVYIAGTGQLLGQPLYVSDIGNDTELANPFTSNTGVIDFYLDTPQRVKIGLRHGTGAQTTIDNVDVLPPSASLVRSEVGSLKINAAAISGQYLRATDVQEAGWADGVTPPHSHPAADIPGLSLALQTLDAMGPNVTSHGQRLNTLDASQAAQDTLLGQLAVVPGLSIFTANGTWNKPANAKWVDVECQGAGGGGGGADNTGSGQSSAGIGGRAGDYVFKRFAAADLPAQVAVTVGLGGAGGAAGPNGGTVGGASSFASNPAVTAGGGIAGFTYAASTLGFIGTLTTGSPAASSGGDLILPGAMGFPAVRLGSASVAMGGGGGHSRFGKGGVGSGSSTGANGVGASGYGSGGGGGHNTPSETASRSGGAGAPGLVIVRTYFAG